MTSSPIPFAMPSCPNTLHHASAFHRRRWATHLRSPNHCLGPTSPCAQSKEEKTYTTTTERESFGKLCWPSEELSRPVVHAKTPIKTRETISTTELETNVHQHHTTNHPKPNMQPNAKTKQAPSCMLKCNPLFFVKKFCFCNLRPFIWKSSALLKTLSNSSSSRAQLLWTTDGKQSFRDTFQKHLVWKGEFAVLPSTRWNPYFCSVFCFLKKQKIDNRQMTHLICVGLKHSLYDFFRGCFGPPSCYFPFIKGPKHLLKESYSKCLRRTQIRWVLWRSSKKDDFAKTDSLHESALFVALPNTK